MIFDLTKRNEYFLNMCNEKTDYYTIWGFRGDNHFLSNFYPAKVKRYPTSEHAYQAAKSLDPDYRLLIAQCKTPGHAKKLGSKVILRPNWNNIKNNIMLEVLRIKFNDNPEMRELLLATDSKNLIEGNLWHDNYWGHCGCIKCKYKEHENYLGRLLMAVRLELKRKARAQIQ